MTTITAHDRDEVLAACDLPAEWCIHLRTTSLIESTFSTVRPRAKVARCVSSRPAALAVVFTLSQPAQA
ncbi:hypothetical protein I2501_13675 [Streptacidiphilus sp. NEAU-YB345]|uniref:Transposase n=1 Tax=Streptacidiphilus fuscans TaxID=2789292 RepID=A0A931B2A7_9ACTN|nr:hypothetical protein [Streptacidiphilus fuscans]MBF9069069.1 hypothetical protein [Streptacidiphilus fuscans]